MNTGNYIAAEPTKMRNYDAANELNRVKELTAFNLRPGVQRRKLNQYAVLYTFPDGSKLRIRRGRADAWHPSWTGSPTDAHLGPIQGGPLRTNTIGYFKHK